MGKCPECEKEIVGLEYYSKVEAVQRFKIDSNSMPEYSEMSDFGEHQDDEYCCPECGQIVATTEEDAIKVLEG